MPSLGKFWNTALLSEFSSWMPGCFAASYLTPGEQSRALKALNATLLVWEICFFLEMNVMSCTCTSLSRTQRSSWLRCSLNRGAARLIECLPSPPEKGHFLKAHTATEQQTLDCDLGEHTGETIFHVSVLPLKRGRTDALMSIMPHDKACSEASKIFQRGILELLILYIPSALGCMTLQHSPKQKYLIYL